MRWGGTSTALVTREERSAHGGLATDAVTKQHDGAYHWSSAGLTMTFERAGDSVIFHFTDGKATSDVACSITDGAIACIASGS